METLPTKGTVFSDSFTIKEATAAGVGFTLGNKNDTRISTLIAEEFH
ncbi:MAG: hypothetical protein ACFFC7_04820 [Candidatus Hermodarchaeota archaeon]